MCFLPLFRFLLFFSVSLRRSVSLPSVCTCEYKCVCVTLIRLMERYEKTRSGINIVEGTIRQNTHTKVNKLIKESQSTNPTKVKGDNVRCDVLEKVLSRTPVPPHPHVPFGGFRVGHLVTTYSETPTLPPPPVRSGSSNRTISPKFGVLL